MTNQRFVLIGVIIFVRISVIIFVRIGVIIFVRIGVIIFVRIGVWLLFPNHSRQHTSTIDVYHRSNQHHFPRRQTLITKELLLLGNGLIDK